MAPELSLGPAGGPDATLSVYPTSRRGQSEGSLGAQDTTELRRHCPSKVSPDCGLPLHTSGRPQHLS